MLYLTHFKRHVLVCKTVASLCWRIRTADSWRTWRIRDVIRALLCGTRTAVITYMRRCGYAMYVLVLVFTQA